MMGGGMRLAPGLFAPGLLLMTAMLSGGAFSAETAGGRDTPPPPLSTPVVERITLDPPRSDRAFGGLSGITYDPRRRHWIVLSDDRSTHAPARFYTLRLRRKEAGQWRISTVKRHILRDSAGQPFPPPGTGREAVDPEAVRITPDGRALIWASEGDATGGHGPAIRLMNRRGRTIGTVDLPPNLRFHADGAKGTRPNGSIEGMDHAPDGALWLAMEKPLVEDGPLAGIGRGALVRFTRLKAGEAPRQYAYALDPIPYAGREGRADNGVSEIVMLDDRRILVLERSGRADQKGRFHFHCRLYLADFTEAEDIMPLASLSDGKISAARKMLLVDFDDVAGPPVGNLEGMAWWPDEGKSPTHLPGNADRRRILLVNDNGFEADRPSRLLLLTLPPFS